MLIDKRKAVKKRWRIPEWFLLTTAFAGGSLGCLLGMYLFRHKTKKPAFAMTLPALLILHILVLLYFFSS